MAESNVQYIISLLKCIVLTIWNVSFRPNNYKAQGGLGAQMQGSGEGSPQGSYSPQMFSGISPYMNMMTMNPRGSPCGTGQFQFPYVPCYPYSQPTAVQQ